MIVKYCDRNVLNKKGKHRGRRTRKESWSARERHVDKEKDDSRQRYRSKERGSGHKRTESPQTMLENTFSLCGYLLKPGNWHIVNICLKSINRILHDKMIYRILLCSAVFETVTLSHTIHVTYYTCHILYMSHTIHVTY